MKNLVIASAALVLTSSLAFAVTDEPVEKKILVEVIEGSGNTVVDLDDGNGNVRMVMVSEDGELHESTGGEHDIWVSAGGEAGDGEHKMIFISEDGNVKQIEGGPAVKWISSHGGGDFVFENGMGRHAVLGVQLVELTPELRTHYGVEEDAGVLVSKVVADSAAQYAGIEVGDILTSVDGNAVSSTFGVRHNLMDKEEGDVVLVDLYRNGRLMTVNADVEIRDTPRMIQRHLEITCEEGDCGRPHAITFHNECDGSEECEVLVTCGDEGCSCLVNDEAVECPDSMPHN